MNETAILLLALIAGLLLGGLFFGGLWWTVRRGVSSKRPVVWFFGSLLARTILALGGFYFISRGDWRRLLACLFGFLLARLVAIRSTREPLGGRNRLKAGGER